MSVYFLGKLTGLGVNMKSDKIKIKGGRHEKNTVLILAMMIMKVEAEDTIKARAEDMKAGIKRHTFNAARAERAVSG